MIPPKSFGGESPQIRLLGFSVRWDIVEHLFGESDPLFSGRAALCVSEGKSERNAGGGTRRSATLPDTPVGAQIVPSELSLRVIDKCDQALKGVWWMSWHREATKDVVACDKLREAGKQALIRRFLNEETRLG